MSGNMGVLQYIDWKLSGVQNMVLEKKGPAEVIAELQRIRDVLSRKEVVDSTAVEIQASGIEDKSRVDVRDDAELYNFYFTFGSASTFPYCGGYLTVRAKNFAEAGRKFREKYPDIHENCLNCAFYYTQQQWDELRSSMGICHEIIE